MRTFDIVSTSIFSPPKTRPAVAYRPSQAQDDESLMYKLSLQNIRALSPKMLSRDTIFQAKPGPQTTTCKRLLVVVRAYESSCFVKFGKPCVIYSTWHKYGKRYSRVARE